MCSQYISAEDIFELSRVECEKYVNKGITEALKNCLHSPIRRKRDFGLTFATLAIASLVVTGLTYAYTTMVSNTLIDKKDILNNFMNISLELTETHQSNMMKVVEELADIKLQVKKLEQYLPRTIIASSEVVHDITTLKEIMRELNRTTIEENKISSRVLSYLNITHPCGKMCPLSSMKNPSFSYKTSEPGKYFLDLQFTVDNYNSEQEIQEADTFIQFNRVNKTSTCKLIYNGSKRIKLNTKTKKIFVMDTFDPQNIELEIDADACRFMKPTTHR